MKKAFDSRMEEAVQVHFRLAELAGSVAKVKWIGFALTPFIFLAMCAILPASRLEKVSFAALMCALFVPIYLLTYKKQLRKGIRKTLVKMLGTDQPVVSEYELDDHGLTFRRLGQEMRFSWANVKTLNVTQDAIEIIMQPMGLSVIPKRIFDGPDELQDWVRFIEEHKASANTLHVIPETPDAPPASDAKATDTHP